MGQGSHGCALEDFFCEAAPNLTKRFTLLTLKELLEARLQKPTDLSKWLGHNEPVRKNVVAMKEDSLASMSLDDLRLKEVVKGVSVDDLRALWAAVDTDGSGEITVADWTLSLYRILT